MSTFFGSDVKEKTDKVSFGEQKSYKLPGNEPMKEADPDEGSLKNPEAMQISSTKTTKEDMNGVRLNEPLAQHDEFSPVKRQKVSVVVKEEPNDSVEEIGKRRRGRPKKHERVPKEMTVTRKSSRIVDKVDMGSKIKSNAVTGAKPLRVMHLDQLLTPTDNSDSQQSTCNLPLGDLSKHNIDAASISHRQGDRRTRTGLPNTLDVLLQFVKEHNAKPKMNDTVNEAMILSEYRLHLISDLEHLRDLHLDIVDISNAIYEVQRKKNDVRRKVLEVKKEHAATLESIDGISGEYDRILKSHQEFMTTVTSLQDLKNAIKFGEPQESLSQSTKEMVGVYSRFTDPEWGLASRLRVVNTKISSMLEDADDEG